MAGLGAVGACADDIAVTLSVDITFSKNVFSDVEELAGLQLNLRKCNMIPLNKPNTVHNIELVRDYL